MKYFDVYIPDVDIVAHQAGTMSAPVPAVSKAYENKKGAIVAYVNSDNDDAGPIGSRDYDNQAIGAGDNDIIKLTLKKQNGGMRGGSNNEEISLDCVCCLFVFAVGLCGN
jgi:hypothetical protein